MLYSRTSGVLAEPEAAQPDLPPQRTRRYRYLAWTTSVAILIILCLPGRWSNKLKAWFDDLLHLPSTGLVSWDVPTDKLVHALLFAVCAAFFVRGWTTFRERWWWLCGALLMYGLVTELIQQFVPGRSAALEDLVADGIGAMLGVAIALLYLRNKPELR